MSFSSAIILDTESGHAKCATYTNPSYSLASVAPQALVNNQWYWEAIEQATRKYVMRAKGDVYVITGPVYNSKPETIGPGRGWVARYHYKLVYDASVGRA
jgi:endonuclease G